MVIIFTQRASFELGLSRIEVLAAVVATITISVIVTSQGRAAKSRAERSCCNCHLKNVGLAFRMYSNDHGDRFPWQVPLAGTGTHEIALSPQVYRHFQVASNELNTPKLLICPRDPDRVRTTNWAALGNTNVSYFIGLDSTEGDPRKFLSGDRNIAGGQLSNGFLRLAGPAEMAWTRKQHDRRGNIGLADGSVGQYTTETLAEAARATGLPKLRLALP